MRLSPRAGGPRGRAARTTPRAGVRTGARTGARAAGRTAGRRGSSRPAQARRSAGTPPARSAATGPGPRRAGRLTSRAAVLGLVVCALVLSLAYPLREYLAQRGEIHAVQHEQAAQRDRIASLEAQKRRWQDPEYVTRQARQRLQYVLPGETPYVVIGPSDDPQTPSTRARSTAADPEAPWYSRLWGSVQAADRAGTRPAPARAPARTPAPAATPSPSPAAR